MEVFPDQGSNLCLLHWQMDSLPICMEFLRWQHCSDWAQIVRCQRWKMEADVAGEEQWEERNGSCIFTSDDIAQDVLPPLQCTHECLMQCWWNPNELRRSCCCQFPGLDIVLLLCRILSLWEAGVCGISLYIFLLQLPLNLWLFQNKKL